MIEQTPTAGVARSLLKRAARSPLRDFVCRIPTTRAIEIIRETLRNRPDDGPISNWLADVVSLISCRVGTGPRPVYSSQCGCFWCRRASL